MILYVFVFNYCSHESTSAEISLLLFSFVVVVGMLGRSMHISSEYTTQSMTGKQAPIQYQTLLLLPLLLLRPVDSFICFFRSVSCFKNNLPFLLSYPVECLLGYYLLAAHGSFVRIIQIYHSCVQQTIRRPHIELCAYARSNIE